MPSHTNGKYEHYPLTAFEDEDQTLPSELEEKEPSATPLNDERVITYTNKNGQNRTVLVHKTADIHPTAVIHRGPVGKNSILKAGVILKGTVFCNVTAEEEVYIGNFSRLSFPGQSDEFGRIILQKRARLGARCLVAAPKVGELTIIGAGAVVDDHVIIGSKEKKSSKKGVCIGPGVYIGRGVVLGSGVVVEEGAIVEPGFHICEGVVIPSYTRVIRTSTQSARERITKDWLKAHPSRVEKLQRQN